MTKLIQKTISKPCHPKFLNEVRGLLGETLSEVPISRRDKDLIILAVDEAVSSVVQYARFKGYQSQVTLTVDIDDVRFKATLVDSLNVFDTIYGTTAGGPGDTTRVLSINGYENAFPFYNLSYGLTVFMMLWVICMVVGFLMYRRVKQTQAA